MCGLVAFLRYDLVSNPTSAMRRALDAISHRGTRPPSTLMNTGNRTLVGHVRLPIVGLCEEFTQPFETDGLVTAFVGEIHDFKEIDPKARNDAWLAHGREGSAVFYRERDGFWSAVHVWDRNARIITDYLGQKPLYLHRNQYVVASEPKAILAALGPQPLDQTYLSNVRKWGYDPTGRTPWTTIERIPPGAVVSVDLQSGDYNSGWYYRILPESNIDLLEALRDSVRRRLVADVPVAVLCSGGLDSTIIALLAAELSSGPLHVFHIENKEREYFDSIRWPRPVEITMLGLGEIDEITARRAYEEPVDLGSVGPQHALGAAVRRAGFSVVLTGDGADELFGGYARAREYDSQASDVWCELPAYHLPRIDRCMMASAVEPRTPFLAPDVIRKALSLPWGNRRGKDTLKSVGARLGVPSKILRRPKMPLRAPGTGPDALERRYHLVDEFVRMHA